MRFILFFLTIFLLSNQLSAQQATIELENGNSIRGKIIELKPNEYTDIEISPGNVVRIEAAEITNISFKNEPKEPSTENPPEVEGSPMPEFKGIDKTERLRGFYHFTSLRMALGTGDNINFNNQRQVLIGVGLAHETGYRLSPFVELGAGFGINWVRRRQMVPAFVSGRFYFSQAPLTGFFALAAGANFGLANDFNSFNGFEQIENPTHGVYIYPAIGLQIPLNNGFKYVVDLGYSVQSAGFDVVENRFDPFTGTTIVATSTEDIILSRLSLRLGLMF